MNYILKSSIHLHAVCACINYLEFLLDTSAGQGCPHSGTNNTTYAYSGPTIQTYEGPQGPGTMLLKSGTVYQKFGSVEAYAI